MADVIIRILGEDAASATIGKVTKGMETMLVVANSSGKQVGAIIANGSSKELGGLADRLGMTRREWMRTGSEAAFYMRMAAGSVSGLSKELTGAVGIATQLGESALFGGAMGVGMAAASIAVGAIASRVREAEEAANAALEPYRKFATQLSAINDISDPLAAAIQRQMSVTREQAIAMAELANGNSDYRRQLQELNDAETKQAETKQRIASLEKELTTLIEMENAGYGSASTQIADVTAKLEAEKAALQGVADARANLKKSATDQIEINRQVALLDNFLNQSATIKAQNDARDLAFTQARTKATENLVKAQKDILAGAIGKSMTFTSVTDLDMQAAALGTYSDKWDEALRRIKTGNLDQYGAQFASSIRALGMPLEEIQRKFENFSLFANKDNIGLINMDAMVASVGEQLDALIGEANVKEAAFNAVMEKLPQDKRDALRKLGIEKLSDADKTLIRVGKSPDFDAQLAGIRSDITSGIPAEMEATVYVTYSTAPGGGGTAPGSELPEADVAGQRTKGNGGWGGVVAASGMAGTVTRSGFAWLDKDENVWASGTRGQVPPPSPNQTIVLKLDGKTISQVVVGHIASNSR